MFHHVALFRWHSGTTAAQVEPIAPGLRAVAATLPGVQSYACGSGLHLAPAGFDFGVVAVFDDQAAWDAYIADEEHDRIRTQLVGPIVAERAGIQFET